MGFLTTVTFYNDTFHQLIQDPGELVRKLIEAVCDRQHPWDSMLIPQRPRHASDQTLYIHAGNCVQDVTEITDPESRMLDHALDEMKYQSKRLRELKKLRKPKVKK